MFNLCNFLKYAPELPATILADYCYSCMFSGCYYLKYAPALPATILANYCYQNMFDSCSALTQIPELPATELKDCCYVYMFNSCYDLAGSISLPNLNLDLMNAFCFMFNYCTSITELHYPKSFADNETFANIPSAPWLGATNAIIYYDL